jgi:hypothetical protein
MDHLGRHVAEGAMRRAWRLAWPLGRLSSGLCDPSL